MNSKKICQWIRILLFTAVLVGGCVLGFVMSLRPTTSESEGRELTKFPEFTWEAFLSGEYTSQISLWYADTFPFREVLLDMSGDLKGFYGVGDLEFSGYEGEVDTIDTGNDFIWDPDPSDDTDPPEDTDSSETIPDETKPEEPETGEGETEVETGPTAEAIDGYYVEGDTCWQLYYYKEDLVDRYCRVVVKAAVELNGLATVYDMVVPTSCCYGLTPERLSELGASDGLATIDYIYTAIGAYCPQAGVEVPVVTLPVHEMLGEHYDDYIYFRTDHHWTGKGAWYASRYFLDAVERPYPSLDAYETFTYERFLGSLYRHTQNENLKNNPDQVVAYLSPTVSELTIFRDNIYQPRPLINKEIATANKYLCFSSGDHEYYEAHNETITDGSSVLIIKESYGNAFIPMLVDSYEYVYAVDYRFWGGDLAAFVEEKGIDTVLFLNNLMATADGYTVRCLEKLVD